ncbi:hypothetical protein DFH09DRAFT_1373451 [Mycena vulgaris]|nr:hypothetical protein DFH09DRAFT_1373451 [Mycena vulgaris]
MDDERPFESELHSESSQDKDGLRNDQYTGAFFPQAQNFVVADGRFKNTMNITHAAPTVPSDFRMIPMGDLDLRQEIRPWHRSGVIFRGERGASVRRVYSARIHGSKSKMTVAVYQGETAEEEGMAGRYFAILLPSPSQSCATLCHRDHLVSRKSWLAQANYIFNHFGIATNYDDYLYVEHIQYHLALSDTGRIPSGYLFLCRFPSLPTGIPSHLRFPACPAYWSLDPSGAERLTTEADELGFPSLEFDMWANGRSWDERVYNGIRRFHEGKCYDPYSQDVARELGYPHFQVVSELESFEKTESWSGDKDSEQDDGLLSIEVDGDDAEA